MADYEDTEFGDIEGAIERAKTTKSVAEPKTFKEAFAAAKKGDTFEWNGKQYLKEFAGEKKPAPSRMLSATESSGSGDYAPAPTKSVADKAKPTPTSKPPKMYRTFSGDMRPVSEKAQESIDNPISRMFKAIRARGESGPPAYSKGGKTKVKKMASGGSTSSASKRADGIATKGKTKCKMY